MSREHPVPLDQGTINSMKSNKRKDTGPELMLRRMLRNAGYSGYRLQWKVPGRPDIAYPGRHVAIFVNGCFWHRCPKCNLSIPTHNGAFWRAKFESNVERDCRKCEDLESLGWTVITVWECEIKKEPDVTLQRIVNVINEFGK